MGEVNVNDEWVAFTPGHVYVVRDVSFAFRTHARDSCEFAWARFILSWGRVDVPEWSGTRLTRGDAGELWAACRLLYSEASGQRREGVLRHAAGLVACMAVSALHGELVDARNKALWDQVGADLQRKWTLDELARLAGKNRETLRRVTLEQHEMSPVKYVSHLRIVRAKQLLEESDLAIAQIADMLGYSTPAIFSKLFKQATGSSPNRWRHQR